jgi:hypothetical protein
VKFKFTFIGHPFSKENPGTTIEVDEWDVPDLRKATSEWLETSDTANIVVEPKFIKIKGKPKPVFQGR